MYPTIHLMTLTRRNHWHEPQIRYQKLATVSIKVTPSYHRTVFLLRIKVTVTLVVCYKNPPLSLGNLTYTNNVGHGMATQIRLKIFFCKPARMNFHSFSILFINEEVHVAHVI